MSPRRGVPKWQRGVLQVEAFGMGQREDPVGGSESTLALAGGKSPNYPPTNATVLVGFSSGFARVPTRFWRHFWGTFATWDSRVLTPEQRAKIQELAAQGAAKAEIARRLKVSRSSVHRVLTGPQGQERGHPAPASQAAGRNRGLLAHLFEIFEDLRALKDLCWGMVPSMKVLDQIHSELMSDENAPGFEEWKQICLKIAVCLTRIERLVHELRLDTPTFQRLYLEMLDVRKAWVRFRSSSEPVEVEEEKQEVTLYEEYLPVLDRIIGNLKKLIIATRQRVEEAPKLRRAPSS